MGSAINSIGSQLENALSGFDGEAFASRLETLRGKLNLGNNRPRADIINIPFQEPLTAHVEEAHCNNTG